MLQPLALQSQAPICLLLPQPLALMLVLLQHVADLWLRQLHQLLALLLLPLPHPLLHLPFSCRLLALCHLPVPHPLPCWHLHQGRASMLVVARM